MASLSDKVLNLLVTLESRNSNSYNETELLNIILSLASEIQVPEYKFTEDIPYDSDYFDGLPDKAERNLSYISRLLEEMYNINNDKPTTVWSHQFMKDITIEILLCVIQYSNTEFEWCNEASQDISNNILDKLINLCGCGCLEQLLIGENCSNTVNRASINMTDDENKDSQLVYTNGAIKQVLQRISEKFNKNSWKRYPGLKSSYLWTLTNLKMPHLSDHLGYLLPPALFILDDWEQKNKLLSLRCIRHILSNTAGSELRWYGRANVIHEAIKPLLYTREPELLEQIYPTLLEVAVILEADPSNTNKISASEFDNILQQLLLEMGYEQKVVLRTIYVKFLGPIISSMGIMAVRWSEDVLNVCDDYLATYDGPKALDRLNILKVLSIYIQECWPQVHVHAEKILKMIVRLVYDVTVDETPLQDNIVERIIQESEDIVKLLMLAAPNITKELCKGIETVKIHSKGSDALFRLSKCYEDNG